MDLAAAVGVPGLAPARRAAHQRGGRLHGRRGLRPRAEASSSSSSSLSAAAPVYAPTPADRPLRTPHSGYHFDGTARPFFEGWYFRVSIPECRQSFCFMYSEFSRRVLEGFQVTPIWHQGFIRDDGRSKYVPNVQTARWEYSTRPVYGWGDVKSKQLSTAGWLAALPFFEPHWQICMAGGLSTGWIEWDGERFEFENAPSYSEKNWGGGFPRKWYWIQCNVFSGVSGEVALTAAGGLRKIGLGDTYESPSLIGVHYEGTFFEFVPWTGTVSWDISPWGHWKMSGENKTHLVEIEATTTELGTTLRAPTIEAGLVPACKDTCYGDLRIQLWKKKQDGAKGEMILDATSNMAALEVGGGPWFNGWKGTTVVNEVVNNIVGTPIDVESLIPIPFLKPPGL
ncbi:hypothetical protein U9M48_024819 [Paspalum notatum var. saurae]|uniref:Tocopherol cyclase n=1 Tax=Paspalum notatum var. saurae TaxID=547442 RepID=A0AAQ3WWZ2_PASNO